MPFCSKCGKNVGLLGLVGYDKNTGRCGKCQKAHSEDLSIFRHVFLQHTRNGGLQSSTWQELHQLAAPRNLDWGEALSYVRGDAIHLLERTLAFAFADGAFTEAEEQHFYQLKQALLIPDWQVEALVNRAKQLRFITRVREGHLPVLPSNLHLEADEQCHLEALAIYHKVNAKSVRHTEGRLVATSRKLRFLSQTGGSETDWRKVMHVEANGNGIYLELSVKTGNGFYQVEDPLLTESVLTTILRLHRRQMLTPTAEKDTRHIPQHLKVTVWQRDQGRCVQCRADSYLEFDHIIPISKGGATSAGNLQLLCRKCNLAKGDRL